MVRCHNWTKLGNSKITQYVVLLLEPKCCCVELEHTLRTYPSTLLRQVTASSAQAAPQKGIVFPIKCALLLSSYTKTCSRKANKPSFACVTWLGDKSFVIYVASHKAILL